MSFSSLSDMNDDGISTSSHTSTGRGTEHSEACSSHTTAASSPTSKHHLYIHQDGGNSISPWPVDPDAMAAYSTTLYIRISQDREAGNKITHMSATSPVTQDALHAIIKAISCQEASESGSSFGIMLDFSIALWNLKCSTALFDASANAVRNSEWSQATEPRVMRLEGWMFIALVFGWGDVFKEASRELIWDYSSDNELPSYLPEELKDCILNKRKELSEQIYESIRNLWIAFFGKYNISVGVIQTSFKERGVDLTEPKAQENLSPKKLLESLADILADPTLDLDGETKPETKRRSTTSSLISVMAKTRQPSGSRVGGLGNANFGAHIVAMIGHRKKDSATALQPATSPKWNGFEREWNSIIVPVITEKIQNFRENRYIGLELAEYSELRGNHILAGLAT